MNSPLNHSRIGVVAIGRNEGQRLQRCLQSVIKAGRPVVYVDSGSTDGSVEFARSIGVDVVQLNTASGFTAARARNAGFDRLRETHTLDYVQFVDGDCEVNAQWMDVAATMLDRRSDVAVVCGRRRERSPDTSVYNRLCDLEWNTTCGEVSECGGDAMMRVAAFTAVHGYDPTLIAGEEPELCVRLRLANWKILRLDAEMTLHDAAMTRLGQWWRRHVRAGYAFAEGAWRHGSTSTRHWVREARRNWMWGLALPLSAVALALPTSGLSVLVAALLYAAVTAKVFQWQRSRGTRPVLAAEYALFCTFSKFPQVQGQLRYQMERVLQKRARLIEYKSNPLGS